MRVISSSVAPRSGRRASSGPRSRRSPPLTVGPRVRRGGFSRNGGRNVGIRGICKKIHVVPHGPHPMEGQGRRAQSRQSGARSALVQCALPDFFPRLWWLYRGKYFRCWGSGCMMWRWEGGGSQRGYCGLSGAAIPMGLAEQVGSET